MLPQRGTPTNFVYLNNPMRRDQRKLQLPTAIFVPLARNTQPRLRDVTNNAQHTRRVPNDPEAASRIAKEQKAMHVWQEKQRQKALRAMQISEERRRRLMVNHSVQNLNLGQLAITDKPPRASKKTEINVKNILKDPTSDFLDKKHTPPGTSDGTHKIIRYNIEELKAMRPAKN